MLLCWSGYIGCRVTEAAEQFANCPLTISANSDGWQLAVSFLCSALIALIAVIQAAKQWLGCAEATNTHTHTNTLTNSDSTSQLTYGCWFFSVEVFANYSDCQYCSLALASSPDVTSKCWLIFEPLQCTNFPSLWEQTSASACDSVRDKKDRKS